MLAADVDVLSYRYDLGNTGLNASENLLTPTDVGSVSSEKHSRPRSMARSMPSRFSKRM